MAVLDAVDTFAGIANENEFYSHHYLATVFKGDIKSRLEAWDAHEALHPGTESERAPAKRLSAWGQKWFALRGQIAKARDDAEKWLIFTQIQTGLLQALGYASLGKAAVIHELVPGQPLPLWQLLAKGGSVGQSAATAAMLPSQLAIVPAYQPGAEDEDLLDHKLTHLHYGGDNVPPALKGESWASIVSEALFGAENPPRYVLLLGLDHWLLLDRYKWPNNRALRFDWVDILDRKDTATLQAAAALLHHDSLAPGEGISLLESLDENAHKHAFGVSEDLKHALREAIELLGNEAADQLRKQASDAKKGFFSGKDQLDPADLSLECLRMVYRLLFMFYIEARPELGYVPIAKSEVYLKGYSLESLRDLERRPLNAPHARDGFYFDATLRRLFSLVANGCGFENATGEQAHLAEAIAGAKDTFALAPLDSRLFDETTMPLLAKVRFPNHVWQTIIRLMSETKVKGRNKRPGRVSYQLLSINQLGAVYEALLSYRGFFAAEDLYEVQPAPKRRAAAPPMKTTKAVRTLATPIQMAMMRSIALKTIAAHEHRTGAPGLICLKTPGLYPPATSATTKTTNAFTTLMKKATASCASTRAAALSTAWPGEIGKRAPATTPLRCSRAAWSSTRSRSCWAATALNAPTTSSPSPSASPPWAAPRF